MTSSKRNAAPTTTVHQSRLRIFQPTRRPVKTDETIDTRWGLVQVSGKLGQSHADLVSAIFYHTKQIKPDPNGRLKMLVDPAVVSKVCRLESRTLQGVIDDVMAATVEILKPDHLRCTGHLIDTIKPATRSNGQPVTECNPLGGQRQLWTVIIGDVGMHLLNHDHHLHYDPAPIAAMHHGVSQAVARLVLSHKSKPNGGWKLNTLIEHACGELSPVSMRNRRREIRQDEAALANAGVIVKNERIFRTACSNNPITCSNNPAPLLRV